MTTTIPQTLEEAQAAYDAEQEARKQRLAYELKQVDEALALADEVFSPFVAMKEQVLPGELSGELNGLLAQRDRFVSSLQRQRANLHMTLNPPPPGPSAPPPANP